MDDDPMLADKRLSELKVVELKAELDRRGLSKTGNKTVLQDRLKGDIVAEAEGKTVAEEPFQNTLIPTEGATTNGDEEEATDDPIQESTETRVETPPAAQEQAAPRVSTPPPPEERQAERDEVTSAPSPAPAAPVEDTDTTSKDSRDASPAAEDRSTEQDDADAEQPSVESDKDEEDEEEEHQPTEKEDDERTTEKRRDSTDEEEEPEEEPELELNATVEEEGTATPTKATPAAAAEPAVVESEETDSRIVEEKDDSSPKRADSNEKDSAPPVVAKEEDSGDGSGVREKKRKWGGSKPGRRHATVTSITSDSLKDIMKEADVVSSREVELDYEEDAAASAAVPPPHEEEGEHEKKKTRHARREDRRKDDDRHQPKRIVIQEEDSTMESGEVGDGEDTEEDTRPVRVVMEDDAAVYGIDTAKQEETFKRTDDGFRRSESPPPARHPVSNVVHIRCLTRPYTSKALFEMLGKFGSFDTKEDFWIDGIKSNCIVKFATKEEGESARQRLHNVHWPQDNHKPLKVDYASEDILLRHQGKPIPASSTRGKENRDHSSKKEPREGRHTSPPSSNERKRRRSTSKEEKERSSTTRHRSSTKEHRTSDRHNGDGGGGDKRKEATTAPAMPEREWDRGKRWKRGESPPTLAQDDVMRRGGRRAHSPPPGHPAYGGEQRGYFPPPPMEEKPAKQLDDLFRKTVATPAIYWLPLSEEQMRQREVMSMKKSVAGLGATEVAPPSAATASSPPPRQRRSSPPPSQHRRRRSPSPRRSRR